MAATAGSGSSAHLINGNTTSRYPVGTSWGCSGASWVTTTSPKRVVTAGLEEDNPRMYLRPAPNDRNIATEVFPSCAALSL